MLDKNDQKFIKDEIEEAVGQIISATAAGFERVENRLDKVENRLDKVENRLDGVENRLDGVENRLNGVETELISVKDSVNNLKYDTPTAKEFKDHEKRIVLLERTSLPA